MQYNTLKSIGEAIESRFNTAENKINVVEKKLRALPESKEKRDENEREDCRCIVRRYNMGIFSVDK